MDFPIHKLNAEELLSNGLANEIVAGISAKNSSVLMKM